MAIIASKKRISPIADKIIKSDIIPKAIKFQCRRLITIARKM
jgi:hypothetical protein